jgi:predicted NBD/HSP70 family sugar kinase/DNA-binding transcriptional ArsR family regulator
MGEGRLCEGDVASLRSLRSGSLESLRERNRVRVIDALRERGAISRADVARSTGLSRSTVSSLVADLQAAGLVVEREGAAGPRGPEGGRPPVLIALDQSAGALIGIDYGHAHVRVAVADLSFTVLAEDGAEIDLDAAGGEEALDLAAGLAAQLLQEAGVDRHRVLAAGMGVPGPIDRETGLLLSRPILPSMDGIDTAAEMQARLDLPVHVDNDANVGALGEATFGAGDGARVMAYLRLSAGIGAGLVIGGRPFRGARGIAGEIGHVLVDPQGAICRCGNRGCLETFVAGPALCELLRRSHGPLTVAELVALANDGDAGCRRVIHDAGRVVGRAVADLCNFINPDLVVVGGELSVAGDLLLDPMREAVTRFAVPAASAGVRITAGVLGDRAEVLGALALAGHESEDPLTLPVPSMSHSRRRSR